MSALAPGVAAVVALAACGGDGSEEPTRAGSSSLTVLAAASLTEAFTELGEAFERDHPGVEVELDFGASSALALQVEQGAPADVYASADEVTMETLVNAGRVSWEPVTFARNRLAILVEKGNPQGIGSLSDLGREGVVFVLCAPEVPCGRLAQMALDRAGVEAGPASLEQDVKAVVSKVSLGEADAGIGYVTDLAAAEDQLDGVDIPAEQNIETTYPIAVLEGAPDAARDFVDFAASTGGVEILGRFGFLPP